MSDFNYEQRKLCLARHLYREGLINEKTPSSEGKKTFSKNWKTWAMWWKSRYGDDINEYIEEMKNARAKQNT